MINGLKIILSVVFLAFWGGCRKELVEPVALDGIVHGLTTNTVGEGDHPTKTGWQDKTASGMVINGLYIKSSVKRALRANGIKGEEYIEGNHKECDNVKNSDLDKKLGGNNTFHKIYEKNATIKGVKVELHYFRDNNGRIFDLKTKWGLGDYGTSKAYRQFNGNYDSSKRYKDGGQLKSAGYFKNDMNRFDYKPGANYGLGNRPPLSDITNGSSNHGPSINQIIFGYSYFDALKISKSLKFGSRRFYDLFFREKTQKNKYRYYERF